MNDIKDRIVKWEGGSSPDSKLVLELYHGRTDPEQQMDDWGTLGPVFRIESFHWTYNTLRLFHTYGDFMVLTVVGDMILYDGVYYGDFGVFILED